MKTFSRTTSIIITTLVVLTLLFLSACNRSNNSEDNDGAETYTNDIPPPPPAPPSQNDNVDTNLLPTDTPARYIPTYGILHQPIDLGGRTIRVASTGNEIPFSGGPLGASNGAEPDPATAENYRIDRMVWDNAQRVRHSFNFEIENVLFPHDPFSIFNALQTSVMAGNPVADIALLFSLNNIPAIMDDIIVPLDSLNLPNSDVLGPQVFGRVESELFGERWSFVYNAPELGLAVMWVNLDIINAIGAPNPVDLYNRGQWTWDAWLEIMRIATQDTTGSNNINQFGISDSPDIIIGGLIAANDGRIVSDNFEWDMGSPNALEAIEFAEIIYREGLSERVFMGPNVIRAGNTAFFFAPLGILVDDYLPFEFAVVPFPAGPSNTTGNTSIGIWNNGFVFPQGSAWNQAEVLMVIEEFWAWPRDAHELIFEANLGWARNLLPTDDDLHRMLHAGRYTNFCISWMINDLVFAYFNFANYFRTQEMTAAQAVDMYRASQQEILDNFFR